MRCDSARRRGFAFTDDAESTPIALAGALAVLAAAALPAIATAAGAIVTGSGAAVSMPKGRTASRWISSASRH